MAILPVEAGLRGILKLVSVRSAGEPSGPKAHEVVPARFTALAFAANKHKSPFIGRRPVVFLLPVA